MTRPMLTVPIGFSPQVVDKVERLLEVLSAVREDPSLGDQFVLHGGTALNVFHDRAPRLSVDIDLMFVGAPEVVEMRARRPEIDSRFREVVSALGYAVQATNDEHSGQTYRVRYPGDYVKVDISYLARVSMLMPEERICALADPAVAFPVVPVEALAVGKMQAMMDRVAARDLYDLHRLSQTHAGLFSAPLVRALAIRGIATTGRFPFVVDPVLALERYRGLSADFTEPLHAMLVAGDRPDSDAMVDEVGEWLAPLSSTSDAEQEFMRLLDEEATYSPELLLSDWPDVLERACIDPVMAWKVENLRRRIQD